MVSKVNLKARIERHSRILKDSFTNIHPFRAIYIRFNYNIVLFFIIVLFPFYPLFSYYIYDNSALDFYRGNIDESSIIEHYIDTNDNDNYLVVSDDSFLSVNTIAEGQRDISGYKKIMDYEIKPGDSLFGIAKKFNISSDSILWSNNIQQDDILKPGKILKIPPVSGVVYKVKSGDTISALALKYKGNEESIYEQNGITTDLELRIGDYVIIPGGIIEEQKVVAVVNKNITQNKKTTTKSNKETIKKTTNKISSSKPTGAYEIRKRQPKWTFVWGNCTWYVAQYKNVDWSGNAKDWLYNASAKGHKTGNSPAIGSIIVFNGAGYNLRYGHVGIVIDLKDDDIIVKDMNYRSINEVTVRKVDKNDRAIKGFIYVD